ncbi:MAG: guanylate kinase [Methylococcales symbiont of Iophon sp. n. MRB-2018]|nr:MAG: guanylate kinase [Methylococcales symbiont of Iophon sp. n. MRB-2018]KAF3979675.1 MAG: guanylate kinase [Methylococcales symbiont of Iophon sp. n. MRB-2018]
MNRGKLYIISAPSGAGKTSLVKQIVTDLDTISVSVSHTTRKIRKGERHGIDYFFTPIADFKQMIIGNAFLESAQVFDNFYGTTRKSVENILKKGRDVILEIDWQGAQQVRKILPESISLFILPPSIEVLKQRLENRGQDSQELITRRMNDAIKEMQHYKEFDYLIVNDDFKQALTAIKSIILSQRLAKDHQLKALKPFLEKLISPDENHLD